MSVCEGMFGKLKQHRWAKLALGGVMLSSLIFVFPVLYGEGYSAINVLLNGTSEADWNEVLKNSMFSGDGRWLIVFIALVILTKTFATAATTNKTERVSLLRWRLRRYVRAVALRGSLYRIPLLATLEHVPGGHLYS